MSMHSIGSDIRSDSEIGERNEADQTIPLLGGMVRPEEEISELDAPPTLGSTSKQTLLLLAVFVVAGATLFMMRRSQTEIAQSDESRELEEKIDVALAAHVSRAAEDDSGADAIVSLFASDPVKQQVPLEDVQKNPFVTPEIADEEPEVEAVITPVKPTRSRKTELSRELAGLKLQTVMQGRHPMAIINSQIVKAGQTLGSFTVTKIGERVVTLQCEDYTFSLSME